MKVKIIETGEIKELLIIDAKSGLDYSSDLLGNHDAYDGFDDGNEIGLMTQETYNWWAELMPRYESADMAVEDYRKTLDDDSDFLELLSHSTGCDLEDMPAALLSAIEQHRDK